MDLDENEKAFRDASVKAEKLSKDPAMVVSALLGIANSVDCPFGWKTALIAGAILIEDTYSEVVF